MTFDDLADFPPPEGEDRSRSDQVGAARLGGESRLGDPAAPTRSPLRSDPPPRAGEGESPRDLSHIDAWIFDLDDTLYPPEQG